MAKEKEEQVKKAMEKKKPNIYKMAEEEKKQEEDQQENKTNDETNNYVRVRKDKYNLPKTEKDKMLVRMPPIFRDKIIKYAEILSKQNPHRRKVSQTEAILTILDEFFKRNKI